MERKSFFIRFLVALVILFIFGLFVFNNSAFGDSEKEDLDILLEFKLALAISMDKLFGEMDKNLILIEYRIKIQKIEVVAGEEYLAVYLYLMNQKRPTRGIPPIWGVSWDRLKDSDDIIKAAREAAKAILYRIRIGKPNNTFDNKRGATLRLFFYRNLYQHQA